VVLPEADSIRQQIEQWARIVPEEIEWPSMPPEIQDRNADVWEPLLAVADLAGGEWPRLARRAAKAMIEAAKEAEPSFGVLLLTDLKTVFGIDDKLPTERILTKLHEIEEAPWGDVRGKPLDSRGLARLLRKYGIKSRVVRIGDATHRGYQREDFADAWSRYVPALPATTVTSETSVTFNGNQHVADKLSPGDGAGVTEVTHVTHLPESSGKADPPANDYPSHATGPKAPDRQVTGPKEDRTCVQCRGPLDGKEQRFTSGGESVWLHPECHRYLSKSAPAPDPWEAVGPSPPSSIATFDIELVPS
jgi:hypothetical protein